MIFRGLNVLDGCSGQRGNVFGVGKCDGGARRKEERKRGGAYCVATRTACLIMEPIIDLPVRELSSLLPLD